MTMDKGLQKFEQRDQKLVEDACAPLIAGGLSKVEALIQCLQSDPHSQVRAATARILGEMNPPGVLPYLHAAVKNEKPSVIEAALDALTTIGDTTAVDLFIAALRDYATHWNWDIRVGAVYGLGTFRDPRAIPALIEALGDQEIDVRYEAEEALEIEFGLTAVDDLLAVLPDQPNYERKCHVLRVLSQISGFHENVKLPLKTLQPVTEVYLNDTNELVRIYALSVLSDIGDQSSFDIFAEALDHPNKLMRLVAASGFHTLGDKSALPLLERHLNDPEPEVQKRIVAAIEVLQNHAG